MTDAWGRRRVWSTESGTGMTWTRAHIGNSFPWPASWTTIAANGSYFATEVPKAVSSDGSISIISAAESEYGILRDRTVVSTTWTLRGFDGNGYPNFRTECASLDDCKAVVDERERAHRLSCPTTRPPATVPAEMEGKQE